MPSPVHWMDEDVALAVGVPEEGAGVVWDTTSRTTDTSAFAKAISDGGPEAASRVGNSRATAGNTSWRAMNSPTSRASTVSSVPLRIPGMKLLLYDLLIISHSLSCRAYNRHKFLNAPVWHANGVTLPVLPDSLASLAPRRNIRAEHLPFYSHSHTLEQAKSAPYDQLD